MWTDDPGDFLRRWRTDVVRISADEAGRRYHRSSDEVGVTGRRWRKLEVDALRRWHFERVAWALGTPELADFLVAATTPVALGARSVWAFNLQGPRRRAQWLWLRSAEDLDTPAKITWGPLVIDVVVSRTGVIVTSPVTVSNPEVLVAFRGVGWADVGWGRPPPRLGIPVVQGMVAASVHAANAAVVDFVRQARAIGGTRLIERLGARSMAARQAFELVAGPTEAVQRVGRRAGTLPVARTDWLAVSRARRTNRPQISRELRQLDGSIEADERSIGAVERSGNHLRAPLLEAAMDMVHGGDGHLCGPVAVRSSPASRRGGSFEAGLPRWWVGPVWFAIKSDSAVREHRMTIRWGRWAKSVDVVEGSVVSCRRSEPGQPAPTIVTPPEVRVSWGVGRHPQAVSIDGGWELSNERARLENFREFRHVYLDALGVSRGEAATALWRWRRGRPLRTHGR